MRLYSVEPGGGFVLVVEQASGTLQRFTLDEAFARRQTTLAVVLGSGLVSGEATGDLLLARQYDLTEAQASLLGFLVVTSWPASHFERGVNDQSSLVLTWT